MSLSSHVRALCCLCCININWRHSELLMMNERAICSCRSWEFITKRAVIGLGRQTAWGSKIGSILRMIDAVEVWFGRLTSNKVKIRAKTNSNFCEIRKTQQTSTSPRVPVLWPHRRIVKVKPGNLRHVESENEQNIEVNKHTTRKRELSFIFIYLYFPTIYFPEPTNIISLSGFPFIIAREPIDYLDDVVTARIWWITRSHMNYVYRTLHKGKKAEWVISWDSREKHEKNFQLYL